MSDTRYALVKATNHEQIAAYMPGNYQVVGSYQERTGVWGVLIAGKDSMGWTLDDYVIPRLQSGNYFARELIVKPNEEIN